ncbi:MAG: hypothetical protein IT213_05140 [Cytophagales bacterium]|jgi:hypothetical protein|nr:hypothetical protein [Cytophagales bacterium]
MERLNDGWLTEGLIDFEYKKYQLMAYFKHVKESFNRVELYPFLSDLVFHYRNLLQVKDNHSLLRDSFPKEISPEGLKNLELNYRRMIADDTLMQELESIIAFAVPQFKSSLDEGAFIYDYVESCCEISPVGLTSLYAKEGYLFIAQPPEKETNVYRYQVTIFEQSSELMQGIHTQHLLTAPRTIGNTYEHLKLTLIRQYTELPNPSVYLVLSKLKFPYDKTLMPIARRLLVKQLAKAA